jgi:hypothetical protein
MHKKLMLACMAIAAFAAFVVAPAASASPVLTDVTGTVAVGSKIKATNVGPSFLTISSGGHVECTGVTLTGEVVKNSGTVVEGNIETANFSGTGSGGDCTSPLGDIKVTNPSLPWCISSTKAGTFSVRGGKCSEASRAITFTMDVTGLVNCSYTKASVNGTYTTVGEVTTLEVKEENFANTGEGNNIFCPTSGKLDMAMRMWTDEGGLEGHPIFIS